MTFEWQVFGFILMFFGLGLMILGLLYSAAAEEQAEHERGALARFTLRVCRMMGIATPRKSS